MPTIRLVVMGPSGCGKSTVGMALAQRLRVPFVDGDDLHPAENVAKMAGGQPLTDADRWPWLKRVAERLDHGNVVVACSALTRKYRTCILRTCPRAQFVELRVSAAELRKRMSARKHFMPPALLDSQLAIWEHLGLDESGFSVVNATDVAAVVDTITRLLARPFPDPD